MANIAGINFESIVDGEGVRVVVFFSGCNHHCKGCHNPETHDFHTGKLFSQDLQEQIAGYVRATPFVSGVTLSGGDPMYSADSIIPFLEGLKKVAPTSTVWIYSGFTYEEIMEDSSMRELLSLCDVLIDGPFILDQRDITLSYRGSRNQRIIDVQASLKTGEIVLYQL